MAGVPATASELVARVRDVFSLPDLYFQLRKLLVNPDTTIRQIADLIARDPGITARMLRIANSAMLGLTTKVDTITRAVNVLGTQQIHDLVLATSVTQAFAGLRTDVMDMRAYWAKSIFCGLVGRRIGGHCNVMDNERLFLEGLLRDIGHLVMYQELPEIAQQAIVATRRDHAPIHEIERRLLGYDFAAIGAELMIMWQIPEPLVSVTRHHVAPEAAAEYQLETNIVHVASILTSGYATGEAVSSWGLPFGSHLWQALALDLPAVEQLVAEADADVAETRSLFVVHKAAA